MSQNPLEQYFRQPKIYITLPSLGIYSQSGTYSGSTENLPVYGMTGMDEIIIKTPDALMSGESSIKIIESCCPSIKDPRDLSTLDINVIFSAIRIATYGNLMKVGHTCSNCDSQNEYELNLMTIIDHYANKKYDNRIVVGDLIIKTRPLSFQQNIEFNIKNYESQQKLSQTEKIESIDERQKYIIDIWNEFALTQQKLYKLSIESIETPTITVTERGHIEEWLSNCEALIINKIKEHLFKLKQEWELPVFPVECDNCNTRTNLKIELDYSNFFSKA